MKIKNYNSTPEIIPVFTEQRAAAIALQAAQYKKQQQHISHMMEYINRFRYKASKAKQAQSRLKAIERLEKIAPVLAENSFSLNFQQPEIIGNPLINLHKVSLGYSNSILLRDINLSVENTGRIGLLGVNGAGKSTLLKALIGELAPLSGEITLSNKMRIGYFAQHHIEQFSE